jgi:hypothetical protein
MTQGFVASWIRFFFQRHSILGLCIFRVLFGFLLLFHWIVIFPDLLNLYGVHGLVSFETIERGLPWVPFRLPLSTDLRVYGVFALGVIGALGLILGILTRLSAGMLFLALISMQTRNPLLQRGADDLMRIFSLYLALSPSGDWLSVDAWLSNRKKKRPMAWRVPCGFAWPMRLFQLQISLLYSSTFLAKLSGPTWWRGTAVYYVTRIWDIERWNIPYILDHFWTLELLSRYTLAIEFALGVMVWVRPLRLPVLAGGLLLHLGIGISLNLPLWHELMISAYFVFLPHHTLKTLELKVGLALGGLRRLARCALFSGPVKKMK